VASKTVKVNKDDWGCGTCGQSYHEIERNKNGASEIKYNS
jgi:hypothetical protein